MHIIIIITSLYIGLYFYLLWLSKKKKKYEIDSPLGLHSVSISKSTVSTKN